MSPLRIHALDVICIIYIYIYTHQYTHRGMQKKWELPSSEEAAARLGRGTAPGDRANDVAARLRSAAKAVVKSVGEFWGLDEGLGIRVQEV